MKVIVINGANINMIGIREPDIYGTDTYEDLCRLLEEYAEDHNMDMDIYQSNHEGEIIDKIQSLYGTNTDLIVINPGGYSHTSVSIMDAIKAVNIPAIEVHISNPDKRDFFRQVDYVSYACQFRVCGFGIKGYTKAIDYFLDKNKER